MHSELYNDIAERTQGDIYMGVVGPVRTGKSTFIKRFMDLMVIDAIENPHAKKRLIDELPQSGGGKTIMTTQPRFIPNEAIEIKLGENASARIRMVDCVGYMVDGALGFSDDDGHRMVRTPWADEEMTFEQAAELGTRKVITDHSTIGIVVTTDGSITPIERGSYVNSERRVIAELQEQNKPFIIILNSTMPEEDSVQALRAQIEEEYAAPVLALDVLHMSDDDLHIMLETVLFEFPLRQIFFDLPEWICSLGYKHPITEQLLSGLKSGMRGISKVADYNAFLNCFEQSEYFLTPQVSEIKLGSGEIEYRLDVSEGLFFKILSEECGCEISGEHQLIPLMKDFINAKQEYDRIAGALQSVRETGYGMIPPVISELGLEEPELIKRGNQYGVRLCAYGPSIHMLRADVTCEVSPVVGAQQQSQDLLNSLMHDYSINPSLIWDTNFFGKTLYELVDDGLSGKLARLPDDARDKFAQTLGKIVNEGSGSMICILL